MRAIIVVLLLLVMVGEVSAQNETGVSIESDIVDMVLVPGESREFSVWVTNKLRVEQDVVVSATGGVSKFIEIYMDSKKLSSMTSIPVGIDSTERLKVIFSVPPEEKLGKYSGYIVVASNGVTQVVPISLRIMEEASLLQLKVEAMTKTLNAADPLKFHVSLYNLGFKERFDVHLLYMVKELATERLVAQTEEEMAIETSLSFVRVIPAENLSLDAGKYFVEAVARYENKSVSAIDAFEVFKPFWTPTKIAAVLLVLLAVVVGGVWYAKKSGILYKKKGRG